MDDGQCLHTITDHCGSVKVCIAGTTKGLREVKGIQLYS